MEIQKEELKDLLKAAVKEALREEKELLADMINEALEDIAMAKAIEAGLKSNDVSEEEINKTLKSA